MRAAKYSLFIAAALCITAPAFGQSRLVVDTDISGDAYLARLAQILDDINRVTPRQAEGEGPLLTISPDQDVSAMPGYAALGETDRNLARAGRRLFDLYAELGGGRGERPLFIQRTSKGLFAARDGMTGQVSSAPGAALGGALNNFAIGDSAIPGAVASLLPDLAELLAAGPGAGGSFDLLKALEPKPIARLARNQRLAITISGPDITRAGQDAVLAGPPGSAFGKIRLDGETLETTLVIAATAADGFAKLLLFAAGDALSPIASYDIAISGAAAAPPAAEADDHGGTPATATLLLGAGAATASITGQIGEANDTDLFSVLVTAPGLLRIASSGASDVDARLTDGDGNVLAQDADSAARYNFNIGVAVAPGVYTLSVAHCCAGAGGYRINAALDPL